LPLDSITSTAQSTVKMVVLDAQGEVAATINIDAPGVNPLALAPIPIGGGIPDVAALTEQASAPIGEVSGQVSKLSLFNPDGSLAWAVDLAASAGVPMLVPGIGDLNLDGVPDLAVNTVQQGVSAAPSAAFQILFGVDGSTLLSSAAPIDGLLAAVPLGSLPTGAAILQVKHLAGSATTELSALDVAGAAKWTASIDAAAMPLNAALDEFTQDVKGFTDLTGDGVPDVGVGVAGATSMAIKVIDGATGQIAWNATIDGATQAVPLLMATAGPMVKAAQAGATTALAVVSTGANPAITLLDGATGKVEWTVKTVSSLASTAKAQVTLQAAGDLDKDGVQDILAVVSQVPAAGMQAGQSIADVPTSSLPFPAIRAKPCGSTQRTLRTSA